VLFARAGYRSVAFDHRGHGESEGGFTSFGYHEARDVAAVQELVCRRWPGQPRAVLGLSMGAAAICFAAEQARGYHAIILESLYHDIASAFASRLRTMYPVWFRPLVPGIICITERRMGVRLEEVVPAALIGKLAPAPVLLVTGTNDDHAGTEVAERLLACCGKPRDLWLVPGAAHCDVFEVGGQRYEERILAFLEHSLGFQGV
jgi:pimeloyl-ACP methyl ester carboxylesterase